MEQRARDVLKQGDALFSKKQRLDYLWQEIALNFYPERADFTTERSLGEEYADHLFSSYPVLARRELGNLFSANLRPKSGKWFSVHVQDEDLDKQTAERQYLEYLTDVQWRAMYDADSQFVRATKEADHDFAAFGNAVIKGGPNIAGDGLLFSCHHLRDNAWSENAEGVVDVNHRKWCPTARQLKQMFPGKISAETEKKCKDNPEAKINCRHIVLPSRLYDYKNANGRKFPFVSLYVEEEAEHVLEETGLSYFCYVIPRWHTVAGSPFGRSMATEIALPDGRTIQVVTRVIREAGEKYVDPPMIYQEGMVRSDLAMYAGAAIAVDADYDERLGDVLRPISQDKSGFPIGIEVAAALRDDIRAAFFLDKVQLPQFDKNMTATEVRRRIQEHIRAAAPLFEPIEQNYSTPLCELAFHVLMEGGAFGPIQQMPESLRGADVEFEFRSPLSEAAEQNEAMVFMEGISSIVAPIAEIDPAQVANVNLTEGVRDSLRNLGWKADWLNGEDMVEAERQRIARQKQMQMGMEAIGGAAEVAKTGGEAAKVINEA